MCGILKISSNDIKIPIYSNLKRISSVVRVDVRYHFLQGVKNRQDGWQPCCWRVRLYFHFKIKKSSSFINSLFCSSYSWQVHDFKILQVLINHFKTIIYRPKISQILQYWPSIKLVSPLSISKPQIEVGRYDKKYRYKTVNICFIPKMDPKINTKG